MPIKYSDYTLDDDPQCPQCKSNDIGIFVNEYYCLSCGFMFSGFASYSKGYSPFSLNDFLGRKRKPVVIDTVAQVVVLPLKNNVVSMVGRTRKATAKTSPSSILPDDYEECADCGYDHGYDYTPAIRWHQAHPEAGECLTQDDLIQE